MIWLTILVPIAIILIVAFYLDWKNGKASRDNLSENQKRTMNGAKQHERINSTFNGGGGDGGGGF